MAGAFPILTRLAQLSGEAFAVAPNDGELASYRSSPDEWANRARLFLREGADDLVLIQDSGSASGSLFAIRADDQSPFHLIIRNDAFSTDPFTGLLLFMLDSGQCFLEPFRFSPAGAGMGFVVEGGDATGAGPFDGGDLLLRGGAPAGAGTHGDVQIGEATTDLIGFYGVTAVTQAAKIADPSGGATQDAEARTAINDLIDAVEGLGFAASV